jgi:integrase/recombinase XerD
MKAYLEPEEVKQLEDSAEYLRDKLLIRLLFRLGCRVSEALGIAVDDIDFDRGTVTIKHLKVRLNLFCPKCETRLSRTAKFCPGCGSQIEKAVSSAKEYPRMRTLPVDADTLEMLKDYIKKGGPVSSNGKQLLFGISRIQAWRIVKECAEKAGFDKLVNPETGREHYVSPHKLRDSFAVAVVKADDSGDSLRMLQEHLGHQSITTTMRYRKVALTEHREWYEKIMEGIYGRTSNGKN